MEDFSQNSEQSWSEMLEPPRPAPVKTGTSRKLVVSLIIIAVVGGYFVLAKYENWLPFRMVVAPTATSTPDTTGWKTYRNEKYGFEFKYPRDYLLNDSTSTEGIPAYDVHIQLRENDRDHIWIMRDYLGFENTKKAFERYFFIDLNQVMTKEYQVNNYEVLLGSFTAPVVSSTRAAIISNGKSYVGFQTLFPEQESELLDQILSTFKFIEPNSAVDTSNWKTYKSKELGIEFRYPSEWNLKGGVSLNTDCFDIHEKGNIVNIALSLPTEGGFFIEGVDKKACANKGLGWYHYAKSPSEIKYKETVKLGNNTFYLDFQRVDPGTHAFHAYAFGDFKVVPSLHLFYNPLTLDMTKEYKGNEREYLEEKKLFNQILSTFRFTK